MTEFSGFERQIEGINVILSQSERSGFTLCIKSFINGKFVFRHFFLTVETAASAEKDKQTKYCNFHF
jgi:hypothetical protein